VTFPYAQFLYRINPIISDWLFFGATFLQLPAYMLIYYWSASASKGRFLVACGILILHGVAVWACFLPHGFYERFW
jgi:hypothetical protein